MEYRKNGYNFIHFLYHSFLPFLPLLLFFRPTFSLSFVLTFSPPSSVLPFLPLLPSTFYYLSFLPTFSLSFVLTFSPPPSFNLSLPFLRSYLFSPLFCPSVLPFLSLLPSNLLSPFLPSVLPFLPLLPSTFYYLSFLPTFSPLFFSLPYCLSKPQTIFITPFRRHINAGFTLFLETWSFNQNKMFS